MGHPLVQPPAATAPSTPVTARTEKKCSSTRSLPIVRFGRKWGYPQDSHLIQRHEAGRRKFMYGLIGGGLLYSAICNDEEANAAGRRPPPPRPTEKKDPNVSGVQAKVLASMKRKDAMKEAMAKLRERGKPVNVPAPAAETTEAAIK